jgi:hypothetical protein
MTRRNRRSNSVVAFALLGNVDEMPVCFDVPFNYAIDESRAETPGTESVRMIMMLTE